MKSLIKRPLINNQIRAPRVRVIDEAGKQAGVVSIEAALQMSRERGLDLIQITEKADPPVCKIMDYGKYLYLLQKKEKHAKLKKSGEIKGIRLSFNISLHDLEIRARQTEKFLKQGQKVRVEMILKGREKQLGEFAKGKINQFLEILEKLTAVKIERELKRELRGFTIIISKG